MTRLHYNLLVWPLILITAIFLTIGNGNYILHDEINLLMTVFALFTWIGSMYVLVARLRQTSVSAWFAILAIIPFMQFTLSLITAFLPNKRTP